MKPWHWLACVLTLGVSLVAHTSSVLGDQLQGSATAGTVSVSLTIGSGSFADFSPRNATNTSGAVAGQSYNQSDVFFLSTFNSNNPPAISDTPTASMAQSGATAVGSRTNNDQTLTVLATAFASAVSAYSANADAGSGSRGIPAALGIPAFSQPTPATLDVDLMSDFGTNPNSAYSVQLQSFGSVSNTHAAQIAVSTTVDSNLPAGGIFTLGVDLLRHSDGSISLGVDFSSPFIAQPIFASDFIAGPNGTYSLDPSKRHFSIPLTIPASTTGYQFSVGTNTFVHITPEPSTLGIAGTGLFALAAVAWRRRRRM